LAQFGGFTAWLLLPCTKKEPLKTQALWARFMEKLSPYANEQNYGKGAREGVASGQYYVL
jgi:hypothetical protein